MTWAVATGVLEVQEHLPARHGIKPQVTPGAFTLHLLYQHAQDSVGGLAITALRWALRWAQGLPVGPPVAGSRKAIPFHQVFQQPERLTVSPRTTGPNRPTKGSCLETMAAPVGEGKKARRPEPPVPAPTAHGLRARRNCASDPPVRGQRRSASRGSARAWPAQGLHQRTRPRHLDAAIQAN